MQSVNKFIKQLPLSFLQKTQQGFTLLEVMLAIIIMATVMVFSIGILQQQAINSQIDKTALQMQQWLEAAKAYYVDNNQWPDGTTIKTCSAFHKPTIALLEGLCGSEDSNKVYIQSGATIENNSWGQPFELLPPSQQNNPNSSMFQVASPVPVKIKNAYTIAQRLVSRLPNATIESFMTLGQPFDVTASVTIPGTASVAQNQIIIKSIQNLQCSGTGSAGNCIMPTAPTDCPTGTQPFIRVALQQFQPDANGNITALKNVSATAINQPNSSWSKPLLVAVNSTGSNSNGSILAIIGCEPSNVVTKQSPIMQKNKMPFSY